MTLNSKTKIFVAGHRGLVGSALLRALSKAGYENIVTRDRSQLDLLRQDQVEKFFTQEKPEYVFIAAARVGGISANDKYAADFLYENMTISSNIIHTSAQSGVTKLLFMGSSCVYPKLATQPVKEESLMTGLLEPTNEGYATAKIASIRLCQLYGKQYKKNFISVIPTNVYGPGDHFNAENAHVIPSLFKKFSVAKQSGAPTVELWGTGSPLREFIYIDDLAQALLLVMEKYNSPEIINIAGGEEVKIRDIALTIKDIVGFKGDLVFDTNRPDGAPRKTLDSSKMREFQWFPQTKLKEGLVETYKWALEHKKI